MTTVAVLQVAPGSRLPARSVPWVDVEPARVHVGDPVVLEPVASVVVG